MLECFEFTRGATTADGALEIVLCYQERQRSRFRAKTLCGKDVGWFVERGEVLADGDVLLASSGEKIAVVAAEETVSQVQSDDLHLLTRAAYHLGNRHVPLQILPGELRYQHDHVLDDMLRGLGLAVVVTEKPFHPENGAYHGSGHAHGHDHHDHHSHSHHGHTHG
ncbi:urease accessory protein UreE [Spongiibacter taiwanensis]|uniref:urease accessory protein UreE n=1 Tax=Spongiibacter taiwanensis TaxID=1748242 RepID=UPI002035250D|nr:urease accessory protein UreE [Spongiibacter taiwanensis]USA44749.1 urease accessory protein UreE [Spongiibacter taiwanensis]